MTTPLVQSISDDQLAELEDYCARPVFRNDVDAPLVMGELRGLIARLRAAEADTKRLAFMLEKHRKVVVELLPRNRYIVYVEEGFMGDIQHEAVTYHGNRWDDGSASAMDVKRCAIDAAMERTP